MVALLFYVVDATSAFIISMIAVAILVVRFIIDLISLKNAVEKYNNGEELSESDDYSPGIWSNIIIKGIGLPIVILIIYMVSMYFIFGSAPKVRNSSAVNSVSTTNSDSDTSTNSNKNSHGSVLYNLTHSSDKSTSEAHKKTTAVNDDYKKIIDQPESYLTASGYKPINYSSWTTENVLDRYSYKTINKYAKQGLILLAKGSDCKSNLSFNDLADSGQYNIHRITNINQVKLWYTCNVDPNGAPNGYGNMFLTIGQIKKGYKITLPTPIGEYTASERCANLIKTNTANPDTLDIHNVLSQTFTVNKVAGNAVYEVDFDAKNAFGVKKSFIGRCDFMNPDDPGKLTVIPK